MKQPAPTSNSQPTELHEWLSYLDEVDGTVEQKRELIEALWHIIVSYCDFYWETNASGGMPELSEIIAHIIAEASDEQAVLNEASNVSSASTEKKDWEGARS
ncbi:MAG: hypothetical protein AAFR27_04230 [Pseudomonadota bacterium]